MHVFAQLCSLPPPPEAPPSPPKPPEAPRSIGHVLFSHPVVLAYFGSPRSPPKPPEAVVNSCRVCSLLEQIAHTGLKRAVLVGVGAAIAVFALFSVAIAPEDAFSNVLEHGSP